MRDQVNIRVRWEEFREFDRILQRAFGERAMLIGVHPVPIQLFQTLACARAFHVVRRPQRTEPVAEARECAVNEDQDGILARRHFGDGRK